MSEELFNKYRPKNFKQVFGQEKAVDLLSRLVKTKKVPRQLLFVGDSGCGKTTLARILRDKLECNASHDFTEINASDKRGIDDARAIISSAHRKPMAGPTKVLLIDEAHRLTGEAQDSLLKLVEEPPPYLHLMLATTNPTKLLKTIQNRCTEVRVNLLGDSSMVAMLQSVLEKEGKAMKRAVVDKIVEVSGGSARKALVVLHSVIDLEDKDAQLKAINSADTQSQGIQVARAIINDPNPKWPSVAKLLKTVDEDPETIRRIILGYASAIMLNAAPQSARANLVLLQFSDHYYDIGKPGLVRDCFALCAKTR